MIHVFKRPATSGAIGISLGFVFRLTWGILMVAGLLSFGFKWLSQLQRAWKMHSARSPHTSCSSVKGTSQGAPTFRHVSIMSVYCPSSRASRGPRWRASRDMARRR